MKINKYLPFAFIYFFINSLGLPFGLTYTAILSPFLYYWIIKERKKEILLPFLSIIFILWAIHFINGVDNKAYLISVLNISAVYIFCQAFYTFLKRCNDIEDIYKKLLVTTFVLCIIAIPVYFTQYRNLFWIQQFLTTGFDNFLRLKLFTYEASYLATLFVPLFFFYLVQIILSKNSINLWVLLFMILLPLMLTFSLGVISCIVIAIGITYLIYFKRLTQKRRVLNLLLLLGVIIFISFFIALIAFPANPLFIRIENFVSGTDLSGKGRTSDAFILANKMLDEKSHFWGIGLGQIKILGGEIIREYYSYPLDFTAFAIPNASAETLAIYGWFGFVVRFFIQIFLFFYTKVWRNYYRLLLFIFVFIYQFTGSFITNLAEYVIWILAFTEVFSQFDVSSKTKSFDSEKVLNNRKSLVQTYL